LQRGLCWDFGKKFHHRAKTKEAGHLKVHHVCRSGRPKNSIEVAFADAGRQGEVRSYGKIDDRLAALDKVIRKLASKGSELHFAYEAGPCGYEIYRHLRRNGYNCIVVVPSLIPRQSGKRIKTDRRDAQMLARLHRAGELTRI